MKIESLPIQAQLARGIQNLQEPQPTRPQPSSVDGEGEGPSVIVDISETAQAVGSVPDGSGESAESPAHLAKAMMENYQTFGVFGGKNFGQLVSQIARGVDPAALFAMPSSESSETSDETEEIPDGEAGLVGVGDDDGEATTDDTTVTDGEGESGGETPGTVAGDDGESDPTTTVDPEVTLAEALLEATAESAEEISDASLLETFLEESDTTA